MENFQSSNKFYHYKKGDAPSFVFEIINEKKYQGIIIEDNLKDVNGFFRNLDFLSDFSFLEGLTISLLHDYKGDYKFIRKLINLKLLNLINSGDCQIDLSSLAYLEVFETNKWTKNIIGIDKCTRLKNIDIGQYFFKNFLNFKNTDCLEKVVMRNSKFVSLEGLDEQISLNYLSINNTCPLTSIQSINNLARLEYIELINCRGIQDFNLLYDLPKLKVLKLINCGKIESIKFVERFQNLDTLILSGNTFIENGKVSYLDSDSIKKVLYPPFIYRGFE